MAFVTYAKIIQNLVDGVEQDRLQSSFVLFHEVSESRDNIDCTRSQGQGTLSRLGVMHQMERGVSVCPEIDTVKFRQCQTIACSNWWSLRHSAIVLGEVENGEREGSEIAVGGNDDF